MDVSKDKRSRLPLTEARSRRFISFIATVGLDVCLGSLWWANESIWKSRLPRYDQQSTRKEHPALSIRKRPPDTPYETIPMLHGTSRESPGAFPVTGLSPERGTEHFTWFGTLRPVSIGLDEIGYAVRQNTHKPALDDLEHQAFETWLQRRLPA